LPGSSPVFPTGRSWDSRSRRCRRLRSPVRRAAGSRIALQARGRRPRQWALRVAQQLAAIHAVQTHARLHGVAISSGKCRKYAALCAKRGGGLASYTETRSGQGLARRWNGGMLHGARTVGATRKDDDGQRSQETARRARRYKPPGGELHRRRQLRRRQLRRRGASCMASQSPVAQRWAFAFLANQRIDDLARRATSAAAALPRPPLAGGPSRLPVAVRSLSSACERGAALVRARRCIARHSHRCVALCKLCMIDDCFFGTSRPSSWMAYARSHEGSYGTWYGSVEISDLNDLVNLANLARASLARQDKTQPTAPPCDAVAVGAELGAAPCDQDGQRRRGGTTNAVYHPTTLSTGGGATGPQEEEEIEWWRCF
jgi:hypothetical protein